MYKSFGENGKRERVRKRKQKQRRVNEIERDRLEDRGNRAKERVSSKGRKKKGIEWKRFKR